jgi:hypothetical protein
MISPSNEKKDEQVNEKLLLEKIGSKSIRITLPPQLLVLFIKCAKEQYEWCDLRLETETMKAEEVRKIESTKKWSESFFYSMLTKFNISEKEKREIFEENE